MLASRCQWEGFEVNQFLPLALNTLFGTVVQNNLWIGQKLSNNLIAVIPSMIKLDDPLTDSISKKSTHFCRNRNKDLGAFHWHSNRQKNNQTHKQTRTEATTYVLWIGLSFRGLFRRFKDKSMLVTFTKVSVGVEYLFEVVMAQKLFHQF